MVRASLKIEGETLNHVYLGRVWNKGHEGTELLLQQVPALLLCGVLRPSIPLTRNI